MRRLLDEQVSLRHSGDFAAAPENYEFEWRSAPPTATGGGLDQDGKADLAGGLEGLFLGGHGPIRARHDRYPGFADRLLGRDLVAHHGDVLGQRPDEGEAMGVHDLREPGVL